MNILQSISEPFIKLAESLGIDVTPQKSKSELFAEEFMEAINNLPDGILLNLVLQKIGGVS